MIVYKVTNLINNKIYIGQTTLTIEKRKRKHEQECLQPYRKLVKFHEALLKYSFESFKWEPLVECKSQEELDMYEKYYIIYYQSYQKDFGYNLKLGGRHGGYFNEEAKYNLGISTKKKWENPETAKRMLEGLRKGTETVKEKAKHFYKEIVCEHCRKSFKVKPHLSRKYCSKQCLKEGQLQAYKDSLQIAIQKNIETYNKRKEALYPLILEWLKNNKDCVLNAKLNDLVFLKDLASFINVKDTRTLGKVLDVKYKKEILYKLQSIIKCTPNL